MISRTDPAAATPMGPTPATLADGTTDLLRCL